MRRDFFNFLKKHSDVILAVIVVLLIIFYKVFIAQYLFTGCFILFTQFLLFFKLVCLHIKVSIFFIKYN
jgi:hypothetical protein